LRESRSIAMFHREGMNWVGGRGGGGGWVQRREKSTWLRKVCVEMGRQPTGPRGVHWREEGSGGGKNPWKYWGAEVGVKLRRDEVRDMKTGNDPSCCKRIVREEKMVRCEEGGNLRAKRKERERRNGRARWVREWEEGWEVWWENNEEVWGMPCGVEECEGLVRGGGEKWEGIGL
jgi:hypothetical protein